MYLGLNFPKINYLIEIYMSQIMWQVLFYMLSKY